MEENIKQLYQAIHKNYRVKNYAKVVQYIDRYCSYSKVGISPVLMNMYAISLYELNKTRKAYSAFQVYDDFYNTVEVQSKLCSMAFNLGEYEEAILYGLCGIKRKKNDDYLFYNVGRSYFYLNQLEQAQIYFNLFLQLGTHEKLDRYVERYLERINKHNEEGHELEMSYATFLKNNKTLKKGHIIKIKDKLDFINENEICTDKESNGRYYYIWKIEPDYVYAFSLTTSINSHRDYFFNSKKYSNLDFNREVLVTGKDNVCKIAKKQIRTVVEKLSKEDLTQLLIHTYIAVQRSKIEEQQKRKVFIKEMENNLKQGNK